MTPFSLAYYSFAIALLLCPAAWLLERSLTSLRWPLRWVWLIALLVAATLPFTSLMSYLGDRRSAEDAISPGGAVAAARDMPQPVSSDALSVTPGSESTLSSWLRRFDVILASGAKLLPSDGRPSRLAGIAWIAGSILSATLLLVSAVSIRRRAGALTAKTVLGRSVRISHAMGPITVGPIRPLVVLPRWALDLPDGDLELILIHEEEHVRARDTHLVVAGFLAVVLYPWNPLMWWLVGRLKAAVELDCDGRTLRRGVAPAEYGALLLHVCGRTSFRSFVAPAIGNSISLLERRLRTMARVHQMTSIPAVLASTAATALLVALACSAEPPIGVDADGTRGRPDGRSGLAEQTSAEAGTQERVNVRIDADGSVHVNGTEEPLTSLSTALNRASRHNPVVSLEANGMAPYRVVADVHESLRDAGLLRVEFSVTELPASSPSRQAGTDSPGGLRVVLPPAGEGGGRQDLSGRNILKLQVMPSGVVRVSGGILPGERELPGGQMITRSEVAVVLTRQLSLNPDLVAAISTHADAPYGYMHDVLGAVERADVTRYSIQTIE